MLKLRIDRRISLKNWYRFNSSEEHSQTSNWPCSFALRCYFVHSLNNVSKWSHLLPTCVVRNEKTFPFPSLSAGKLYKQMIPTRCYPCRPLGSTVNPECLRIFSTSVSNNKFGIFARPVFIQTEAFKTKLDCLPRINRQMPCTSGFPFIASRPFRWFQNSFWTVKKATAY